MFIEYYVVECDFGNIGIDFDFDFIDFLLYLFDIDFMVIFYF